MPIFDFACEDCGLKFEKLVMRSDSPAPMCKSCESVNVIKQVSAPAFRLAGSGWYETDFKTGKKKNIAGGESNSSPSVSSSSSTSSTSE